MDWSEITKKENSNFNDELVIHSIFKSKKTMYTNSILKFIPNKSNQADYRANCSDNT